MLIKIKVTWHHTSLQTREIEHDEYDEYKEYYDVFLFL